MKRLGLILLIVLVAMVALSPHRLLYDEPFHINGAVRLVEGLSLTDLLAKPTGSALGPLYPVIHAILAPLTGLRAPSIRVVNVVALLLSVVVYSLHLRGLGDKSPFQKGFGYLAIPMVWACSGMALTEIPAQLFALIAVVTASPYLECGDSDGALTNPSSSHAPLRSSASGIFAGLSLGLAILGRQGYLAATPLLLLPVVFHTATKAGRKESLAFSGFATAALILLTAPVFWIWGGFTPPSLSSVSGFSFAHGLLGFLYLGLMTLFVCPYWFAPAFSDRRSRLLLLIASAVLAVVISSVAPMPMRSVMQRLPVFIQDGSKLALVFAGSLLLLAFFSSCFLIVRDRLLGRMDIACLVVAILGAATCFALKSQFSSRYLLSSLPFLLYAVRSRALPERPASIAFACLGALLGVASLASYYQWI